MRMQTMSRRDACCGVNHGASDFGNFETPDIAPRMIFGPRSGPAGDILICLFQRGGMDGLSAVPPYGDGATYYDNRKNTSIPAPGQTDGALNLDGHFGLHPKLQQFKEFYDSGKLAVIQATGSIDPSRSHFDAERFMEQATPGNKTVGTGWIARHLETSTNVNESPLRAVGFGSIVQYSLRGTGLVSALALESISSFRLEARSDEAKQLTSALKQLYGVDAPFDILSKQAKLVFDTADILKVIRKTKYEPANGAVYPDHYFGRSLKQIAQLIKAEVGLEVACADIYGWDTHETQGTLKGNFADLIGVFGDAISALYKDLGDKVADVTIVTMSEFGRCVPENGSKGTDHGHGNAMFVLGGGVNGGKVYTEWPTLEKDKLDDVDLAITIDQREILSEIVTKRLANPLTASIFPGFTPSATPLNVLRPRA
jgi:uncharacterized protein (DUF1501 family)